MNLETKINESILILKTFNTILESYKDYPTVYTPYPIKLEDINNPESAKNYILTQIKGITNNLNLASSKSDQKVDEISKFYQNILLKAIKDSDEIVEKNLKDINEKLEKLKPIRGVNKYYRADSW